MAEPRRLCAGPCGRNRAEKFFTSERGTVCEFCQRDVRRRASRNARLQKLYDITQEEYEILLDAQDGKCAGCGGDRRYNLAVDHDHALEKKVGSRKSIRGLLCKRCNGILRDAWDIAQVLRNLADYLDDPPAQKILAALSR